MKIFILALALIGCGVGVKVRGNSTHTVQGTVVTENIITIKIDVSACDALSGEQQAECIIAIVNSLGDLAEIAKTFACKDQECLNAAP